MVKEKTFYEQPTVKIVALTTECILTFSVDMKPEGDYDDGKGWND